MSTRLFNIIVLLFVTLASVSLVEGGYWALEKFLFARVSNENLENNSRVIKQSGSRRKAISSHDYRIIIKRNLFAAGDKDVGPLETEIKPMEELRPSTLELVLMGTILGDGVANRAFIMDKKNRKQDVYEVGDAVAGAFIKKIIRGKVILASNGQDEVLDIAAAASVRKSNPSPKVPTSSERRVIKRVGTGEPVAVDPGGRVRKPVRMPRKILTNDLPPLEIR